MRRTAARYPEPHEVGSMTAWCGLPNEQDVTCALAWEENKEGEK
jgi:hypothetical protein